MQNNEPIIPDKTIELAAKDVRRVLDQQKELNQNLTAKLNILFVANKVRQ